MKRSFVFSICCTLLFLTACNKDSKPVEIDLNKPFQLNYDQGGDFPEGGFEILFAKVNGDSRCPSDVDCVWEGEVSITIQITESDTITEIELTRNGALTPSTPTIAAYGTFEIFLTEVNPYPKETNPIKEKDYEVTLEVRKI